MEHGPSIGNLVFVAILAFVVPLLLNRFKAVRIPIAAGEILAGILVGKSGLGLIHTDELLEIFNFLGLAALMFLAGMEIDLSAMVGAKKPANGRPHWLNRLHNPLGVGVVIFGASTFGAWWFAHELQNQGLVEEPLFFTLIIATCGLSIILPVLKDRHLLDKPYGQVLFTTAVFGDFVPMLGLSVLAAIRVKGSALESLWILALIAAGFLIYWTARKMQKFNLLKGLSHGTAQIGVRAAFALMLGFVAVAQSIGVEAILGAFLAGLLLSALAGPHREEITHKLDALGFGFLIPFFFLMVGVEFDVRALINDASALVLVPVLLAGTILVKAAPGILLWLWHPLRRTVAGMILLTSQMSVTIAASAIAYEVGAYGASTHAAVVLVAITTAILGPVAFNKILGDTPGPEEETRKAILLAGMNRLSLLLGKRLKGQGFTVVAVDKHPDRAVEFIDAGIPAVIDSPASESGLAAADAKEVGTLVAITGDEAANLAAARVGKEKFGIPRALLFITSQERTEEALAEGFEAINPDLAEVHLVENAIHNPQAFDLLTGTDSDLHLADFQLTGGPLAGRALREVTLPEGILVVAVLRGKEKIVPHGDTVLQTGDVLTVVCPESAREQMRTLVTGV